MKKLFVAIMAVVCLASCGKDAPVKGKIYSDEAVIGDVIYGLTITDTGEEYCWENTNKTDEVALTYKFNYERKTDLQKDFAELADGITSFDSTLLPAFAKTFRFVNHEDREVVVHREIDGASVLIVFVVGTRTFKLPYSFIIGANNALNPKDKGKQK